VRGYVFSHALAFVAGFTLVFVLLFGIPATILGNFVFAQRSLVAGVGGLLIMVLGLHMAGFFKALARLADRTSVRLRPLGDAVGRADRALDSLILPERRLQAGQGHSPSYVRSAIVGITFAAGWTPCIGPLLGLVLTLAAVNPGHAIPLLLAYSIGLAVPFLLTAALLSTAIPLLKRLNRFMHVVELVSGIILVMVGLLLVLGTFSTLNVLFSAAPVWLTNIETSLSADVSNITFPLAMLAGMLSFLSPCVLPLVPVYLGYLSGTVVGKQESAPQ